MNTRLLSPRLSDVSRPDGTRLVVGMDAQANAAVWLVRTP